MRFSQSSPFAEDSDEQQYAYTAQRVGYVLPASWSLAHAHAPQSCHIQGYLFNAFPMDSLEVLSRAAIHATLK